MPCGEGDGAVGGDEANELVAWINNRVQVVSELGGGGVRRKSGQRISDMHKLPLLELHDRMKLHESEFPSDPSLLGMCSSSERQVRLMISDDGRGEDADVVAELIAGPNSAKSFALGSAIVGLRGVEFRASERNRA